MITGSAKRGPLGCAERFLLPSIFSRPGTVWRAIWLGIVVMTTIFWANVVFAQYEGGTRDPGEFYWCTTRRDNDAGLSLVGQPYGDIACQILYFQAEAGNPTEYDSLTMVGAGTTAGEVANVHELKFFVMPPRGMQSFTYHCTAQNIRSRTGTSSLAGWAASFNGLDSSETGAWSVSASTPALNQTTSAVVDVVGTMTSGAYDLWWTRDFPSTWSENGTSYGQGFEINVGASNGYGTSSSVFECNITSWVDWPTWLETNPPWVPPSVIAPTPTPGASFEITRGAPLVGISNTIEFDIGAPGTPECTTIIPSGGISETVFGYEVDSGWSDYEVCTEDVSIDVEFMGIDFVVYVLLAVGILSVGGVYKFFRTG